MLEEDFFSQKFENCGAVEIEILKLEDSIPDKRTKEYDIWVKKMNFLFESYNTLGNFAAYKIIK